MTDLIGLIDSQYKLEQEAKEIAMMALIENREYGTDPYDMIHQIVDDHQSVIYTYRATILCANCDTDNGEEHLDETDYKAVSFNDYATKLAYAVLLDASINQYNEVTA